MTSQNNDLLPCQFCGEARISFNPPNNKIGFKGSINCPACLATMPREVNDDQELIDCWNTRASTAPADDEAYELGKRDGYESAIQDIDIATGGDGEFKGSTIPGVTVDVPAMKARVIERLRDEARLRQCAICGFTIDTSFAAAKPSADFTTRGRAKLAPDEASIRADERERCAKWHDQKVEELKRWAGDTPSEARGMAVAACINMHRESAAAIRAGRGE